MIERPIPDNLWQVMKDYRRDRLGEESTEEFREWLESIATIDHFDGGAFISVGNELDLFVLPENQGGRWRMRSTIKSYLDRMTAQYGTLKTRVLKDNTVALRLDKFYGFKEVGRDGDWILMER